MYFWQLFGYNPAAPPSKNAQYAPAPPLERHFIYILRVYREDIFGNYFVAMGYNPAPPQQKRIICLCVYIYTLIYI